MTQKDRVWNALQAGRVLTPLEALREFGCFRLGARICELRKELPPHLEIVTVPNKDGPKYAHYFLRVVVGDIILKEQADGKYTISRY